MIASTSPEDEIATDADGAFALDGLVPGKISFTVKHPDYSDANQTIDVKEGTASAEIKLTPGSALGGLVVSDAQQPLPGADVVLQSAGDTAFGRGMLARRPLDDTDSSGRFRFDHLTAGRFSLVASLRSRSSATQTVVLQDGQSRDDAVLQIAAGATLQGVVSGLPDSWKNGMTVTVSGADSYSGMTRTGADGRFQFSGRAPRSRDAPGDGGRLCRLVPECHQAGRYARRAAGGGDGDRLRHGLRPLRSVTRAGQPLSTSRSSQT